MSKGFSTEIVHKIYDDELGNSIDIGPDADTGDLLEIRQVEGGKIVARIVGEPEQMRLVAEAILKLTETE
jgi:hypothetical protein